MKYLDGSNFTAQTLDGQGKALAKQNISFNVNGVFYHKTTDENGIANLNIRLNPGKYIITSIWNEYQVGNNITIAKKKRIPNSLFLLFNKNLYIF